MQLRCPFPDDVTKSSITQRRSVATGAHDVGNAAVEGIPAQVDAAQKHRAGEARGIVHLRAVQTEVEQHAWRNFISGSRRLLDRLERDLKSRGLSHDDYGVLVALSEAPDGRLRMAGLADLSVESRSRLSHHIRRMEANGLVRRESCPNDLRGSFAVLTEQGRALMEETAPHHVAGVRAHFLDQVEPDELTAISTAFARIDEAFGPTAGCSDA